MNHKNVTQQRQNWCAAATVPIGVRRHFIAETCRHRRIAGKAPPANTPSAATCAICDPRARPLDAAIRPDPISLDRTAVPPSAPALIPDLPMPLDMPAEQPAPPRSMPAVAYMSGIQALVQLPMLQRARDQAEGRNTAGFVSGYRGSPLGTVDQALWKAKDKLAAAHVVFQPGVNEELAMTAVWGVAAGQPVRRREIRRRVRLLVWQGSWPGPQRGCAEARQRRRLVGAMAVCWWWWATTMGPNPPPCPTRATTCSRPRWCRC